jgi:uncharacterized protein
MTIATNLKRMTVIDALRGFSLFGIVIEHSSTQFFGMLPESKQNILIHGPLDKIAMAGVAFFLVGRFFTIFSLLFGLSFFIQMDRANSIGTEFKGRFVWRMFLLLLIGVFNFIFYQGDILIIYALLGVPLIFCYRLKAKYLVIIAIVLFSGLPRFCKLVYLKLNHIESSDFSSSRAVKLQEQSFEVTRGDSLSALMKFNIENWKKIASIFQIGFFGRGFQTFALFLLGLILGRIDYFRKLEVFKSQTIKALKLLSLSSVICLVAIGILFYFFKTMDMNTWSTMFGLTLYDLFNLSFSGVIISIFFLLYDQPQYKKILGKLIPIGKMGLTVYLMQNLVFTSFYFGWGGNWFGSFGVFISLVLGLLFYLLQMLFATYWFTKFQYGPLEWLWRSATFFKFYPLNRKVHE